jgi:hypothetical protein
VKVLLSVLAILSGAWAAHDVHAAQPSRAEINAVLEQATNEISKKLPRNIDKETVLFAVEAGDLHLKYYMQVPNISAEQLKPVMQALRINAKNLICTTPNTRTMVNFGVVAEFAYYDNTSAYIGGYSVSVKDCDGATPANLR